MKHKASRKFWKFRESLPEEIELAADKAFALLKEDIHHPSLRFKKLADKPYWSARINDDYRALAGEIR